MEFVPQPHPSYICGQCCVAMISGESLEVICSFIGKGSTKTRDLILTLNRFGIYTGTFRLDVYRGALPNVCILKVKPIGCERRNWHWVVYYYGKILDPSWDRVETLEDWLLFCNMRIFSYLEIIEE